MERKGKMNSVVKIAIVNDNATIVEMIKEIILDARSNWTVDKIDIDWLYIRLLEKRDLWQLLLSNYDIILMDYDLGTHRFNGADLTALIMKFSSSTGRTPIFVAWSSDDHNNEILCSTGCVAKPKGYNGQVWCTYFEHLIKTQQELRCS